MSDGESRRPRGRPRIDTTPVTLRLGEDLLPRIDAWIERYGPCSRPHAIRCLLRDHFGELDERARRAL